MIVFTSVGIEAITIPVEFLHSPREKSILQRELTTHKDLQPKKQGKSICHCVAKLTSESCCELFIVAARMPLIALRISCIKCKNLLSFEKETELKED